MFTSAELLDSYPRMRLFALRLTRNETLAEDLLHDTVVKIYQYEKRFIDGTNFRAWSFSVLFSVFLGDCRRVKRGTSLRAHATLTEVIADRSSDPEDSLALGQVLAALGSMGKLGEACLLHALCGDLGDVAEIQGISTGTVKSRVNRARKRLDDLFDVERSGRRGTCTLGRQMERAEA